MGFTCSTLTNIRKEKTNSEIEKNKTKNRNIHKRKTQIKQRDTPELVNKIIEKEKNENNKKEINNKNKQNIIKKDGYKHIKSQSSTDINKITKQNRNIDNIKNEKIEKKNLDNKNDKVIEIKKESEKIKDEKESDIATDKIESSISKIKEEPEVTINKKKSYSDFDMNSAYNCVCPDCKSIPIIKEVDFVEELNDFKIKYICKCNYPKEGQEPFSYLINFINQEIPNSIDTNFISSDNLEKILEIAKEKKNATNGLEILEKLCRKLKKFLITLSMAPPPAYTTDTKLVSNDCYMTIVGNEVQNSKNELYNKSIKISNCEQINQITNQDDNQKVLNQKKSKFYVNGNNF